MSRSFTFSVLITRRTETEYVAHCLELDLIGDGKTADKALAVLRDVVRGHIAGAKYYGTELFSPAPRKYWKLFEKAPPYNPKTVPLSAGGSPIKLPDYDEICVNSGIIAEAPGATKTAYARRAD